MSADPSEVAAPPGAPPSSDGVPAIGQPVTDPALLAQIKAKMAGGKGADPKGDPSQGIPAIGEAVTDPALLKKIQEQQLKGKSKPESSGHGSSGSWEDAKLPIGDAIHVAQADTFEEKELYFQNKYGKNSVSRDWGDSVGPSLVVNLPDGKKFRVTSAGIVAQIAADSPKLIAGAAGAAEGAELGMAGGPLGSLAGGIGGFALGSMGGKTLIEGEKALEGNYKKTPQQYGDAITGAAKEGAEAEAGGRMAGKVAKTVMTAHLPAFITGATDESKAMTHEAWAGGAQPSYASMAPDAKKLQRIEIMGAKLAGDYKAQDERNMAFVTANLEKTLRRSGMPSSYVDQVMSDAQDKTPAALSHDALGTDLKASVKAHVEAVNTAIDKSLKVADTHISAQMDAITKVIDTNSHGALGEDVGRAIMSARQDFSDAASAAMNRISSMVGNKPVVSMSGVVDTVRQITKDIPPMERTRVMREIEQTYGKPAASFEDAYLMKEFGIDAESANKITLGQAQNYRAMLRKKAGYDPKMTRGADAKANDTIGNAFNKAIQDASSDPDAAPAVQALNSFDKWYSKNISKFKDAAFTTLAKNLKTGMPPDPENIVATITSEGHSTRIGEIRNIVGPDVWKRVQSVHMDGFLRDNATAVDMQGKPVVDGIKLIEAMNGDTDTTKAFAAVHGKETIPQMKELGKLLAAREGKIDPEALSNGDVAGALRTMKDQMAKRDEFMKTSALAQIANPNVTAEEAYQWLARPGPVRESNLRAAVQQFGADSPQIKGLQQAALEEMARNANITAIKGVGNQAIEKSLMEFTPYQREVLFPGDTGTAVKRLSKVIEFMFPYQSGVASDQGMAGMAVGAIQEAPIKKRLYKTAVAAVMRYTVLHPNVAKLLVTGYKEDETAFMRNTAEVIKQMAGTTEMEHDRTPTAAPADQSLAPQQ